MKPGGMTLSRLAACWSVFFGGWLMPPNSAFAYTQNTLYSFCISGNCTDGSEPHDLAKDDMGNLYGTTFSGGAHGDGTVFQFAPGTGGYKILYDFCSETGCADGKNPYRVKLVVDVNGNLYGTTMSGGSAAFGDGGGVIFELIRKKSGWRYKILHTFCSKRDCKDGALPPVGLTYSGASAGALYDGVSPLFGLGAYSIFQIVPKEIGSTHWKETVLHTFCQEANCSDGAMPGAPLYMDGAGNLYGTTEVGGQANWGTVFRLSPSGDGAYGYDVLYSFCAQANCTDGGQPESGVVIDATGDLFGTAAGSGAGVTGPGTLFKLAPQERGSWQYTVLASFGGSNGSAPLNVILGANGDLLGTTYGGGSGKKGTVFKFDGALQTIYNFCSEADCTDGARPVGGLIEDANGNLFGTTELGANHNSGTIYELSP
jgi:uncharacterized repeat protein (TIGR03803 family)